MGKKITKATAQKKDKKLEALKVQFPLIKYAPVTTHKKSEIYELETEGYKLYVELNDSKITIKNICDSNSFIFDTVRNNVTKGRWQAIARLIIEATKLI